jgi:hypothetical protein
VEVAQLGLSWPFSRQTTTRCNIGIRNQGQIKI